MENMSTSVEQTPYEAPSLKDLGSFAELTLKGINPTQDAKGASSA